MAADAACSKTFYPSTAQCEQQCSALHAVPAVKRALLPGTGFVGLPVSEPTGGSVAAAALIVSASGTADFSSMDFGSVALTCISQLKTD